MIRYVAGECSKCDFSEGGSIKLCGKDYCCSYEPTYTKMDIECEIGYATLEEFDKVYGTNYAASEE